MKKQFLTLLLLGGAVSSNAQFLRNERVLEPRISTEPYAPTEEVDANAASSRNDDAAWHDDFSDPSTWVIDNDGQSSPYGWGIRTSPVGWWTNQGVNSSSGGNFAELNNGDPTLTPGTQQINVNYSITTAQPIDILDLAGTDQVLLQFEQFGARFNDAQTVEISTDGQNFIVVGDNSDFLMLTNTGGSAYPNPNLKVIDLNPFIAGNASSVWIRFNWTSAFPGELEPNAWVTYGWYIDDVSIVSKSQHDLVMEYGYISHIADAVEYGRVPTPELLSDVSIGASVFNFGTETQTNVTLAVTVTNSANEEIFSETVSESSLAAGDTAFLEILAPSSAMSNPDRYNVSFTVTSDDEDADSPSFGNNTKTRRFEITEGIYSLDGIGVHVTNQQLVGNVGNTSFTDADVDFMLFTYYEISENMTVPGIEVLLGQGTQREGAFMVSIHASADLDINDVDNALAQSNVHDITQQNATSRRARVMFPQPVELAPGGYYAAVRILSEADDKVVRIQDDLTVPQPFGASLIYIPGDGQVFTNGNAYAIRLLGDIYIGIEEEEHGFAGANVYPNPTNGDALTLSLTADRAETLNVRIVSMLGAEVMNVPVSVLPGQNRQTLTTDGLSNGLYMMVIEGNEKRSSLRVMVQR
jgi:hypothetical protein